MLDNKKWQVSMH